MKEIFKVIIFNIVLDKIIDQLNARFAEMSVFRQLIIFLTLTILLDVFEISLFQKYDQF